MKKGPAGRYPIRATSRLTGIGIDTLRAWERRYNAVTPERDGRGRMYTETDLARLRLLNSAVAHGHSIGRLAGLSDDALRRLGAGAGSTVAAPPARPIAFDVAALDAALRAFDAAGMEREIARLATVLGPLELLQDVLMPLLAKVGEAWHTRRKGIAHEHLITATTRSILGSFLRLYARRDVPARLLFATLSGERHEIGTLGAAMLAASSGLGVTYLGPDLPARDIVESARLSGAQVLVLGLTAPSSGKATERELRVVARHLPAEVELWVGGRDAERHAAIIGRRGLVLQSYAAYQHELVRIGGQRGVTS